MKNKRKIFVSLLMVIAVLQFSLLVQGSHTKAAPTKEVVAGSQDIVEIAVADDRFETLVAALQAAGLADALKGNGPYTVFAPTDDAFAKLPAGTVETLLKPENKAKLVDILTYHVYPGKVTSMDAKKLVGQEVPMLNGKKVKITEKDGNLYINDAKVIITDIVAKNGIIHVIDTVLLP